MKLSTFDVARILGVSDQTVRNWAKKGYIEGVKKSPTGRFFWNVETESEMADRVRWDKCEGVSFNIYIAYSEDELAKMAKQLMRDGNTLNTDARTKTALDYVAENSGLSWLYNPLGGHKVWFISHDMQAKHFGIVRINLDTSLTVRGSYIFDATEVTEL